MKSFNLLVVGKNSRYVIVVPNFQCTKFDETNEVVLAKTLTPFGLPFNHEVRNNTDFIALDLENNERIKKELFKKWFKESQEKIKLHGADYLVVNKIEYKQNFSSASLDLNITCQFFVEIN